MDEIEEQEQEEPNSSVLASAELSLYWIAGRLLLVGIPAVVDSLIQFTRDAFNLYGLFGAYCVYTAWHLLRKKAGCGNRARHLLSFILGVDCLLCGLLLLVLLAFLVADPNATMAIEMQPSGWLGVLACLSLPADILFCRWALRRLRSESVKHLLLSSQSSRRPPRLSLADLMTLMAVFALALSTYVYDLRSEPFGNRYTYSSSRSQGEFGFSSMTLPRRSMIPFGSKPQTVVIWWQVDKHEEEDGTIHYTLKQYEREDFAKHLPPIDHNLGLVLDGHLESGSIEYEPDQLDEYLNECLSARVLPSLEKFRIYLERENE